MDGRRIRDFLYDPHHLHPAHQWHYKIKNKQQKAAELSFCGFFEVLGQTEFFLAFQYNLLLGPMDRRKLPLATAHGAVAEAAGAGLAQNSAPLHAARKAV